MTKYYIRGLLFCLIHGWWFQVDRHQAKGHGVGRFLGEVFASRLRPSPALRSSPALPAALRLCDDVKR